MSTWIRSAYCCVGQGTGGQGKPWQPADVNGVAVEPQRNNWSCGPAALRYCLLVHGIDKEIAYISRIAGSTRAGTDERKQIKAARHLGCKLANYNRRSPVTAHHLIETKLRLGVPLILCVEKWQHWIAVIHKSRKGFLVFDSNRPGPVIKLRSWKWVERRLRLTYCLRYRPYFKNNRSPIYSILSLSRPVQRRHR